MSLSAQQQLSLLLSFMVTSFDSYCRLMPSAGLNSTYRSIFMRVPNFEPLSLRNSLLFLYTREQWFLLTLISFMTTLELLFLPMVISSSPSPMSRMEYLRD